MKRKIIRNIIIVIIILAAAFLSQQAYFGGTSEPFFSQGTKAAQDYWAKGSSWVGGEAQKRGDIIKNEINQEKEKVSETIGEKIKNYFSGIIDNIFNPGKKNNESQSCSPCQ